MIGSALLGGVIVAAVLGPFQEAGRSKLDAFVPRMETAVAQLAHARRVKRTLYEKKPDERAFWRRLAVDAYRAVRQFHPDAKPVSAEAAFRAGELLRAGNSAKEAVAEFRIAIQLGAETPFHARGRLEIAHLHRRANAHDLALSAYLDVAADAKAEPSYRDDAWLWAGRIWKEQGQPEDARRAWRNVTERGADPLDRVLAFDYLGLSWLDGGDPEAAAGVLDECRVKLSRVALEETQTGERVRNAMLRMRLVEELPEAIETRKALKAGTRITEKNLTR